MKTLLIAAAVLLLAACNASPVYNRDPVIVKAGELGYFWQPAAVESDVRVPADAQKKKIPGRVVVAYIIDSEGRVINPQVVRAEPAGVYNKAALDFIRTQRFQPAASNAERVPVRTLTEVTFNQ